MYGLTQFGFYRPTKIQIRTELLDRMREDVDSRIKIDVDSKLFRQMDMIAGEIDDIWEMGASIVNGLNVDTALGEQLKTIGALRGLFQNPGENVEDFRRRVRNFKGFQRGLSTLESMISSLPWVGRVLVERVYVGAHRCLEVKIAKKRPTAGITTAQSNQLAAIFAEYGPEDVIWRGQNKLSYDEAKLDPTFATKLNTTIGASGAASYAWTDMPVKLVNLVLYDYDTNDPHPIITWLGLDSAVRRSPERQLLRTEITQNLLNVFDTFDNNSKVSEDELLAVLYRTTSIRRIKLRIDGRDNSGFSSFYINRDVVNL
jgi:hypothetical protein